MLGNDPEAAMFVGGTLYQAFLSAMNYHCWHSPVSETIVKAFIEPETYYSEAMAMGWDSSGPNKSQGYITEVATQAIIFIKATALTLGRWCLWLWEWPKFDLCWSERRVSRLECFISVVQSTA